ncbi:SH3 domain-containing protein [Hymenobacter montanus]
MASAATTLNLRAASSAESTIVRVLERNDVVTVQELTNAEWGR